MEGITLGESGRRIFDPSLEGSRPPLWPRRVEVDMRVLEVPGIQATHTEGF